MATPHPERELDRLRALCRSGLPPVVVLSGGSAWFRTQAVETALAAVPKDAELATVDGQDVEVRGLGAEADAVDEADAADGDAPAHCEDLQLLAGGSLFARTAFLSVRRGDRWLRRHGAAVLAFLPRIRKGSGLIVETQKLDKRTKLGKQLLQHGAVFELRDLYEAPFGRPDRPLEGELVQWIVAHGRKLGVQLQPEAALLLLAQIGKEPGELAAELQLLADRIGKGARTALSPDELRGKLGCSFESTPFELAEAVLAGDRRRALRSLHAMFARGVKQRDGKRMDQHGLFPFATSWLFQSLGQVHDGRLLLDQGTALRDVAARAGVTGFTERFEAQVRANPAARLEHGLLALLHCQREKRMCAEDDDVLLERFLMRWFDGLPVPAGEDLGW